MKKLLTVIFCLLLLALASCGGAEFSDEPVLTVSGAGLSEPVQFSLKDLQAMDTQTLVYSTVNNFPSTKYAKAQGCSLAALLDACEIGDEVTQITVSADDGFSKTFSRDQLLGTAYFYDLSGNPTEVVAILAWAYSDDSGKVPGDAEPMDDLRLIFGQQGPHQANASASVQHVSSIEVSTEPLPRLQPCSFNKTAEGLIELVYDDMDQVKLYYTLDGTDPDPLTSEVYNPSTSNFQPELNAPLDLPAGTKIRAMAVGFGWADSEISEYVVE
ncbi:MAG: chitobiase/beta-hexosaminidase C-terminal domain-containing protein [Firmicutes bacterium]|nr:chitobiase/beta-hexosaminidase C-terminal domain-containing protein [Bacillota bacterium]